GPDGELGLGSRGQLPRALQEAAIAPWGDLAAVAELLRTRQFAALFCEPVLCNSGVIAPPEGFLEGLRQLCDETGTVLVFDEVITGFRMSRGGAAELYGVVPDLVTLAKAVAGGYPLAAVAGTAELLDATTAGIVHAGTYNGNPVVLAAAKATLEALDEPGVYEGFERHGRDLASGFARALAAQDVAATVNQVGPVVQCIVGVPGSRDFEDFLAADQAFYDRLLVQLLRRGIFTLPGGRWYISTAHTEADIAATIQAFAGALATAREAGRPARAQRRGGPSLPSSCPGPLGPRRRRWGGGSGLFAGDLRRQVREDPADDLLVDVLGVVEGGQAPAVLGIGQHAQRLQLQDPEPQAAQVLVIAAVGLIGLHRRGAHALRGVLAVDGHQRPRHLQHQGLVEQFQLDQPAAQLLGARVPQLEVLIGAERHVTGVLDGGKRLRGT